jgi:hypothetical protein
MPDLANVTGGVAVGRGIAAADVTARAAHAQVHPPPADLQAVLATGDLLRPRDVDLIQM